MSEEPVLIERHYVNPTMGLDLTFKLSVAAFLQRTNLFILRANLPTTFLLRRVNIRCHLLFVFEDPLSSSQPV